jgi:MYXO-CTERM domain-containing protein
VGARRRLLGILLVGAALFWSPSALAHQEYPPAVDSTLGLKKTVETFLPPTGCQLCHQGSGGATQLNSFGSLLVSSYGLSNDPIAAHVPSLEQALMNLEGSDPKAVQDLKNGIDPNTDPVVFENALPAPQYGCSLASQPVESIPPVAAAGLLAIAALALARRRAA